MTRIRYTEATPGAIVSIQAFVAGSNLVKVLIKTVNDQFLVEVRKLGNNSQLDDLVTSAIVNNLAVAKKTAKSLLTQEGVYFASEVRRTKTMEKVLDAA